MKRRVIFRARNNGIVFLLDSEFALSPTVSQEPSTYEPRTRKRGDGKMNKWQPPSGTVTAGTLEPVDASSGILRLGLRVFFLESWVEHLQGTFRSRAQPSRGAPQLERPLVWVAFSDATKASLESLAVEHKPDRDDLDAALHCAKVQRHDRASDGPLDQGDSVHEEEVQASRHQRRRRTGLY